ncbi:MAG: DNA-3-methyladenine glycosylase 2 family protein [Planctomycetota bacterium]
MSKTVHQKFLHVAEDLSPRLAEAIAATGPVRLEKTPGRSLGETLCRAVAGQQLSTKAAATIWGRVVERGGEKPLLEFVRRARPQTMRACGLSAAKTRGMKAIADAHHAGDLDERALERMEHTERIDQLTAIRGVGPWTADMIGIFHFGDPDVWPDGDLAVRNTLQRLTSKRRKTHLTAARFAPHRSYLAIHMWRVANSLPTR